MRIGLRKSGLIIEEENQVVKEIAEEKVSASPWAQ